MTPSTKGQQRIGILGGTFDPIHIGHLIIAEEARHVLALDRVIFVPARRSPLKQENGFFFDEEERWEMVCRAIEGNPHFEASRVDLEREPPSFTVDTLRILRQRCGPHHAYWFIMGADSLIHFPEWYQPQEIIRLARLAIISRPEYEPDWPSLEQSIPSLRKVSDVIQGLAIGISSTEIRRRLRQGLPFRYHVPASVFDYIMARQNTPHG